MIKQIDYDKFNLRGNYTTAKWNETHLNFYHTTQQYYLKFEKTLYMKP